MEENKRRKNRWKRILLLILMSIPLAAVTIWGACAAWTTNGSSEYATLTTLSETVYHGSAETRRVDFANGDVFEVRSLTPDEGNVWLSHSIFIPGDKIRISYTNARQEFITQTETDNLPLKNLFVQTSECDAVISICSAYADNAASNTRIPIEQKERPLIVTATTTPEKGYVFSGGCSLETGQSTQMWYLMSRNKDYLDPFFSWSNDYLSQAWSINGMDDKRSRLCIDGYYFNAPSSYSPYEDGMLYRMPACYAGVSFARYPTCRMDREVGYALLRISASSQNEQGYWATGPSSTWLQSDFGIGAGFFDTRFNTDFATGLTDTYKRYHDKELLGALLDYTKYFINHAKENHIAVGDGWLVRDYAPSDLSSSYKKTHSSLNHQAAEIIFLNKLDTLLSSFTPKELEDFQEYDFVRNVQEITDLSQKMLKGIENTADYWVMPDHNLKYAYGYEGSMELPDYPYLTYDDLFTLNAQLKEMTGKTNDVLEHLMAEKKIWMDANEVTGYRE